MDLELITHHPHRTRSGDSLLLKRGTDVKEPQCLGNSWKWAYDADYEQHGSTQAASSANADIHFCLVFFSFFPSRTMTRTNSACCPSHEKWMGRIP
ncbi:hypothetical protein M406DRAFT_356933 [Cryphonectria parasitica EP155]|uniref:Uncharacterized protein n=1 Tax=Cryphonectria parasitica (strain ATCC 38755 / EP155) TaxID=660469 RepID=A0A9P5CMH6_CRYP1|nr:uncharacterized protein M406DRAFT_356933 [Cryphonectria parasitica EP155]KAF3763101.1 hypothetical protein M406DRAFT_356933 [Cryphonectria parasitica EP155]